MVYTYIDGLLQSLLFDKQLVLTQICKNGTLQNVAVITSYISNLSISSIHICKKSYILYALDLLSNTT